MTSTSECCGGHGWVECGCDDGCEKCGGLMQVECKCGSPWINCLECNDEGRLLCGRCNGSGEGMYDETRCSTCGNSGAVDCECGQNEQANIRDDEADYRMEERKERRREKAMGE